MTLSWYVGQVNLIGVASIWNIRNCVNQLLCFRHISESRFLLDAVHRRSKFANFYLNLMQNHLS